MDRDKALLENMPRSENSEKARTAKWYFLRRVPAFLDTFVGKFDPSMKIVEPYIKKGQAVADIGCGWGYFSFALADLVGPDGKVIAVDIDPKCTQAIRKKAARRDYRHVEARTATAADMSFIPDGSVDFVFANGLLCSMAVGRQLAVSEIKRMIKPDGTAYLNIGNPGPPGFMDEVEWKDILAGFQVVQGAGAKEWWAVVSLKG